MFKWIQKYNEANLNLKFYTWNWVIYLAVMIVTTIYCYGRLDFVRSYPAPSTSHTQTQIDRTHK